VKIEPNKMKWVDAIWKFLFVVENEAVANESIRMLRMLHLNLSDEL